MGKCCTVIILAYFLSCGSWCIETEPCRAARTRFDFCLERRGKHGALKVDTTCEFVKTQTSRPLVSVRTSRTSDMAAAQWSSWEPWSWSSCGSPLTPYFRQRNLLMAADLRSTQTDFTGKKVTLQNTFLSTTLIKTSTKCQRWNLE